MHAPATVNDASTTATLTSAFEERFGEACTTADLTPASEDFSILARAIERPYVFWTFGGYDGKIWDDAVAQSKVSDIPHNRSSFFAPVVQPTLSTGVDAMALAALVFLGDPTDDERRG